MRLHLQATYDLLKRYAHVFAHAWKNREEMEPEERLRYESEFLPAALALQDTPVSPAPRVAMFLIVLFVVIALIWAMVGKMDVVATAQGKLIPDDRIKTIQPLEPAKVTAIHVVDGQEVKEGDLLIELDGTIAAADVQRLKSELSTARLQSMRAGIFLEVLSNPAAPRTLSSLVPDADHYKLAAEQALLEGQLAEYYSKDSQLQSDIERREAELRGTGELLKKLEETAPIARKRVEDLKALLDKNFVSKHEYLQQEKERIEIERDLSAQRNHQQEIASSLQQARRQKESLLAETRRTILDERNQSELKVAELEQELIKAQQRGRFTRLTAPVSGTVQQLAVHTVGGVVTEAQALMVIVPKDNPVVVEAFVQNKDIGFVYAGQDVVVKVETFPFTKYGTIPGKVVTVSNDAVNDEKRGLIYPARIKLGRSTMKVEQKTINLTPGMAVTAEVKIGKRKVIEYFLSPLMQYKDESLRER